MTRVLLSSQNFVDGTWRDPEGKQRSEVVCPSTEEVLGYCPTASDEEVDAAVSSARQAFDEGPWSRMPVAERAALVERAMVALSERAEDLGHLQTSEMGAPIGMSVAGARRSSATGTFFADMARSTPGVEIRNDGIPAAILREPVGVVAAIAPWNGPVGMALGKILPALLAGCSVVFKAAPETPFDISFLVDALAAEGLPSGALNVVSGGASTGAAMVRHAGVDKVSFTGSTGAGRQIAEVWRPAVQAHAAGAGREVRRDRARRRRPRAGRSRPVARLLLQYRSSVRGPQPGARAPRDV